VRFALSLVVLALALVVVPAASMAGPGRHAPRRAATTREARSTRATGAHHEAKKKLEAKKKPEAKKPPAIPAESVGSPNEGRLEGGVRLDTSVAWLRVMPGHETPDRRWGLPSLVHMIDRAAHAVAKRYPKSVLGVGDLSRKRGGDVGGHHSHESGRDADLAFYVVDAKGKPVSPRRFLHFDASLAAVGAPGLRFDVARNWLFVQSMLLDRKAHVSHIFLSDPLRLALLAHAKKLGVASRLRRRAAMTLMQPTGAPAHDDHFHVRISCPRERGSECVEIAKGAPMGARAGRTNKGAHHRAALRTPRAKAHSSKASKSSTAAAAASKPAAAKPADFGLSRAVPLDDADADAFEVKDALDDVGALRITD
jgi:penicillin-insensitive murein endopeptidase